MDDFDKHVSSYHQDQEILDARGINITVEEVAGLPTVKYSEKVQSLQLNEEDLSFLKGLRRRIKNRLASQNSRRRSLEHLRRLTRELRLVRARRDAALAERRALLRRRDAQRDTCRALRRHISLVLQERSDPSLVPDLEELESPTPKEIKTSSSPDLSESYQDQNETYKDTFECRIEKLVQKSVNHIYDKKKVSAKTVFLDDKKCFEDVFLKDKVFDDRKSAFIKHETDDDNFINHKNIFDDRHKAFLNDSGYKQEYDKVSNDDNFVNHKIFDDRNKNPLSFIKDTGFKQEYDKVSNDNNFVSHKIFDDRIKNPLSFIKDSGFKQDYDKVLKEENGGVLDLCVKEKRRSHGRKQSAPRRIAYVDDYNDVVLDLKIKKENQ